jgi:acyl-CoA synthetase (NDP forming)
MEGVKDGRRFFEVARDVARKKPVIIWKGGATAFGAKAAASHTGSLAGSQHVWDAMFRQTGMISVTSFEEVIDCCLAFYYLPLPKGRRVAIICGQGGTGVGTADNCIRMGLQLSQLSENTLKKMKELITGVGVTVGNPADIGVVSLMKPHLYGETIKILADDENVDMILAITSPNMPCLEGIVSAARGLSKPLITSVFSLPELSPNVYEYLSENHVPAYSDPKKGAFVLSKMADYRDFLTDA